MKNLYCRAERFLLTLCLGLPVLSVQGQEDIKVLSYNVLNYPNASYQDFRADTLAKIFTYYKPDLFLMQELKAPRAIDSLLLKAFNTAPGEHYDAVPWRWQVSAPWNSNKLMQSVIYNQDKLTLIEDGFVQTGVRDHNIYKFMVNDPEIDNHQDSTFVYVISSHLKASQGQSNVDSRLAMTQLLMNYLDQNVEPDAYIIFGGDFNVYTSNEPAYQLMLNGNEGGMYFADPISTPGNWHLNATFAPIHTQSTRTFQVNGDGAGGGLDDRFDFVMLTPNMLEPSARLRFVNGTYENIGNSGNCFNQLLTSCTGGGVPQFIRHALWQMSDHLPVKLEISVDLPFATSTDIAKEELQELKGANAVRDELRLQLPRYATPGQAYQVYNLMGQKLMQGVTVDAHQLSLQVSHLPTGWYLLHINEMRTKPFRFMKL